MSAIGILPRPGTRGSGISPSIHTVALEEQAKTLVAIASPKTVSVEKASARVFLRPSFWVVLLSFLLSSTGVFAQNDVCSIVGFVSDSSGAVVPNAKVTIKNEGTGESRTVSTDSSGHYAVPNLPPTAYTMTAEATGFQKFESTHNVLASNSTISIDAVLTLGAASQTVEVTA